MTQQADTRSVHRTHLVIERELYDALRAFVNQRNADAASPVRWTITGVVKAAVAEYLARNDVPDTERVA